MAGLLAARVLSEHYEQVTLVERDACPNVAAPRKGVPQGRHAHVLLASGARILEGLFPGLADTLVREGALWADAGSQARIWLEGSRLAPCEAGLWTLVATRPAIEHHVRARVLQRSNVTQLLGCEGRGLKVEGDAVVALCTREPRSGRERELPAEFVVDASGRGSRLPRWLVDAGFTAPEEQGTQLDVGYTTCVLPRAAHAHAPHALVISPHPENPRGGIALPVEDHRWIVTLVGYRGDHPPADAAGFRAFAAGLPSSAIADLLNDLPATTAFASIHYRRALRRRYDRLTRLPRRMVALGDALCSFNPVYAQGISVAAREAQLLERCLTRFADDRVGRVFFDDAARLLEGPWRIVCAADERFSGQRERSLLARLASAYIVRLQRAAAHRPSAARAVLEVMHMVAPIRTMFAPKQLVSACRDGNART